MQWKRVKQEERQGLKPLWQEVEKFLASLSRAERIRKCRKQKEEERSCSFKSPFKHKAASGGQEEWETENNKTGVKHHIREKYSDSEK